MSGSRTTVIASVEFPTYVGGIGTQAYELARHWQAMGEGVVAVVRLNGEQDLAFDQRQTFRTIRVKEDGRKLGKFWVRLRALRQAIAETNASGIYASDWRAGLVAYLATWGRIPYVVALYGSEFTDTHRGRAEAMMQRFVMRRAKRVISISRYTTDLAIRNGAPPDRTVVIAVGSDPDRFVPNPDGDAAKRRFGFEGRRVILAVGRLVKRKGHETVLRAMPAILAAVPDALYAIVGTGSEKPELARSVAELGIEKHVRFMGKIPDDDLAAVYAAADVFVLTGSNDVRLGIEGFGIVFLDAGCCEIPVVGGRTGGIIDAIEDGETGLLVDPDSAEETAAAVIRLLQDPDLAKQMGQAARRRVLRDFTWRRVAERTLEAIYE